MITDPWLLDPVCACCKNMAWAAEQDMLIRDCEKCKSYRERKWCADGRRKDDETDVR